MANCRYLKLMLHLILSILLVHSNPVPDGDETNKCPLNEEDLGQLKSAITVAASAKQQLSEQILSNETLAQCPMLKNITDMLQSVATDMLVLKGQSVSNAEVELLRESFEEKISEIAKNKDIFEKQAKQESSQAEGERVEQINKLQLEMAKLYKEIEEETKQMYNDMAEFVFERLKMNDTDAIGNYIQIMLKVKLHDLFAKLRTDNWVLFKSLKYVETLKDKSLARSVLNTIIGQIQKLKLDVPTEVEQGKNALVNLLCWQFTSSLLYGTLNEDQKIFQLMRLFFPKEKGCKGCEDVKSRTLCGNNHPAAMARAFG